MAKERILVVEDEEDILSLIRYNLEKEAYRVSTAFSGEQGLKLAIADRPDLILLDLMLPNMDGLEVCRLLKRDAKTQSIPIVILTAKGEDTDVVAGLELGADDYVVKPFSPKVLIARLRAILRRRERGESTGPTVITMDGMTIHPGRHEVLVEGLRVDLTSTEFRLLHLLAGHPGWVYTRAQIVDAVRGEDYPVTDRSVDVQIVGLRKKLGQAGGYIETVRGVGYRFKE